VAQEAQQPECEVPSQQFRTRLRYAP
jgi:hypothetical protein